MNDFDIKIELYKRIRSMTDEEFKDFINEENAFDMAGRIKMGIRHVASRNNDANIDPAFVRQISFTVVVGKSSYVQHIILCYPVDTVFKGINEAAKVFNFTCTIWIDLSNCDYYEGFPVVICKYDNGKLVEKVFGSTNEKYCIND